jgi:hypothetical protein
MDSGHELARRRTCVKILESISEPLAPYSIEILVGNDPMWKYWCLKQFGHSKQIDPVLLLEIQ